MTRNPLLIIISLSILLLGTTATLHPNDLLPSFIGIDYDSGCYCREYPPKQYATCYGPKDCTKFPRKFQTTKPTFKLITANVKEILKDDLMNLHHVTQLDIEGNRYLRRIESGVFRDMTNLRNLSISFNPKLTELNADIFDGLVNLEELKLIRNGFRSTKKFSLALRSDFMPKLRRIDLQDQNCSIVEKEDLAFLNGTSLREFHFVDSYIELLDPQTFNEMKNLRSLSLGENKMRVENLIRILKEIKANKIPLTTLNLSGWGFKNNVGSDLIDVIANSTIKKVILSKNHFDFIDDKLALMPNIEYLNLNEIKLKSILRNSFKSFPNLKSLSLSGNRFMYVPDGLLLPQLKELDISYNSYDGYFILESYRFVNMSKLEKLDLSGNNIRSVPMNCFSGLSNLKWLNLKDSNVLSIHDKVFADLVRLEYLDLSKNLFPTRRLNKEGFYGLKRPKHLVMTDCKIKCFSEKANFFEHLPSLKTLDLKNNFLQEIAPEIFLPLVNLQKLDVSNNQLAIWRKRIFGRQRNFTSFIAPENKFTTLTDEMLKDFVNLTEIDISANAFICDCMIQQERYTITEREAARIVKLINNSYPTYCVSPQNLLTTTIVAFAENYKELCKVDELQRLLKYIIPSAVLLAIALILLILSYVYRWHIRYWIFLTKLALTRREQFHKRRNIEYHTNYLYDAFVSYSNEDRNFVVRLVSMLENYEPFLKLCVYDRDFELGTVISDEVLFRVSRSRKTLLVISDSYIKSQWCIWEAQVAENHRLFFENEYGEYVNDSIIIIKLGNISNKKISPMLRYLIKTRKHLQWDVDEAKQTDFWTQLRNALAPGVRERSKSGDVAVPSNVDGER